MGVRIYKVGGTRGFFEVQQGSELQQKKKRWAHMPVDLEPSLCSFFFSPACLLGVGGKYTEGF